MTKSGARLRMQRAFVLLLLALVASRSSFAQRRSKPPVAPPPPPPPADKLAPDEEGDKDKKRETFELNLAVGENKTIPAQGVRNYSEGTPGIVDVKLTTDGNQFVVVGLRPGTTTLLLIRRSGTEANWIINVFARSPEVVEHEVRQLLEGYTGVRVRRVGSRFFIDGGVSTEADLARIKQIAALYPGQVESLVTVGGGLDRQTNIRIDFYFVQYNKNYGYAVGLGWPARIADPATIQSNFGYNFVTETATAQTAIVNQPLPALDIASRLGWAKVMKQATVITTNGIEASVGSGGEQNVQTAAGLTSSVTPIRFGTDVKVLPRFDPQTRGLEIKVEAHVSDLVAPQNDRGIPGRQTASLSTLVHLKLGQSLILSGVHTRDQRHAISGIPGLSEIPVFGIFFGSHSDQAQETDGAVFIVPSIVEPVSRPELVNEALEQYEEFTGNMKSLETFPRNPPEKETK